MTSTFKSESTATPNERTHYEERKNTALLKKAPENFKSKREKPASSPSFSGDLFSAEPTRNLASWIDKNFEEGGLE